MYIPKTYGSSAYAPEYSPMPEEPKEERPASGVKKRRKMRPRAKRMILLSAVWASAILLLVRYAIITEECRHVEQLSAQLSEVHSEVVQEELKLNKEINLAYVEEYATETLGMVRPSSGQEVYITVRQGDTSEVIAPREENGAFASMGARILKVLEYLY